MVHKKLVLLFRYPVNTLSEFVTMVLFFFLIFFGGRTVAGPALTDSLDGIIVGFFLFTLATASYSTLTHHVTREAQWGTLERLYMSPFDFGFVMGLSTVLNICLNFLWAGVLLLIMMGTTGRWLSINLVTVLPLTLLTLMSVVGIGFLFGGLAVVYKRVEKIFSLLQFGFIGLIAAPVEDISALKLLPLSHGSYLTRLAMAQNVRIWEFPATELGLLALTSTLYLVAGYLGFSRLQVIARRRGLMGHY